MPEGTYTYYCSYPAPLSVNGTTAVFDVPAVQDGKVTGGADVMVASPAVHGPLTSLPEIEDHSNMRMEMNRMMHQFRFYVPEEDQLLGDEKIERILMTFPTPVTGDVVLDVAEKDADITSLTASFDGGEAFTLSGNRVYETVLNSSALTLNITAQWPSASLASGKVVLENVTVINPDALLRTLPAAHDRKNWEQWLRNTVPFAEVDSGRELFVQALPGIWQLFDQEVFPVSRGGTGISEVADGDMLVGKDGGFTALRKSDGSAFMYCDGEKPEWMGMDLLADFGYARFASGTYVGTGTENPITLPVEPKLLIINKPGKITSTYETDGQSVAVLQQGTSQAQNPGGSSSPYVAGIQLEGNTLTPYMSAYPSVENPKPRAWNENGVTYSWFAIY